MNKPRPPGPYPTWMAIGYGPGGWEVVRVGGWLEERKRGRGRGVDDWTVGFRGWRA